MQFRFLIRIFTASLLAYSLFILAPRYTAKQCSKLELRGTAPCVAFFTAQDAFFSRADRILGKAQSYPQVQSIQKIYNELELERHFGQGLDTVNIQWNTVVKPKALRIVCKSAQLTVRYSTEFCKKLAVFSKETAWPILRKNGKSALTWARKQLQALWVKFENSRYWEDVIIPQAHKIYKSVRDRAMQEQSGNEGASKFSAAATPSRRHNSSFSAPASAFSSSSLAEASASLAAEAFLSSSVLASASLASNSSASASSVSASGVSASSAGFSSSASSANESSASKAVPAAKQWAQKIQRNIDFAITNLQDDAANHLDNAVEAAKPEIMGLLREIAAYGEDAVVKVGKLAAEVKAGSETSVSKKDIFDAYEMHLKTLADLAFKVRNRSEMLAYDSLEGLKPVRLVTLDAVDDYFDAVLSEAAREMTINDEWNGWKEYHKFKRMLTELRKTVENYEFDMTVVNTALRESQSASIILVQQYNQKLADLRAECQLIFQQRETPQNKAAGEPQKVVDQDVKINIDETKDITEPIEENIDLAGGEPVLLERSRQESPELEAAKPLTRTGKIPNINLVSPQEDRKAIHVPFDESVDVENSEIIETVFETQVISV